MFIRELTIENFRGIKHLTIPLSKDGAVFYGINGVGKSSIIKTINIIFSKIIDGASQGRFKNSISVNEEDVSFGHSSTRVHARIVLDQEEIDFYRSYDKNKRRRYMHQKNYIELGQLLRNNLENDSKDLPVFVVYGVNRLVIDVPLRIRDKHSFDRLAAYEKSSTGTDFRVFFEWFRNQEDYENQVRANQDPGYQDTQLKAVRGAIYTLMPGFTKLMVERRPRLKMVVTKDNTKLSINQLSDGEKCYIAMIGDLARRMAIANPDADNPLQCSGIVLIDEIELHLHPEWQRKIVSSLRKTFPNVQFVITTHSPQVLGEIKDMDIFKLIREDGHVKAQRIQSVFGRDSGFILEQFMDTSEKNTEVKAAIRDLYGLINRKKYTEADKIIEDLATEVGNDDTDVVRARILIARGKAKSEENNKNQPT